MTWVARVASTLVPPRRAVLIRPPFAARHRGAKRDDAGHGRARSSRGDFRSYPRAFRRPDEPHSASSIGEDGGMADCVVVTLQGDLAAAVEALWSELERRWGLRRSHVVGSPHMTLAILQGDHHRDRLRASLAATAGTWTPFAVTGAGYGVFVGHGLDSPVLHLAVTRTPRLTTWHEAVLCDIAQAGLEIDGQSRPEYWRPHVTIADTGLTPALVGEVMSYLVERGPRHWTLDVDNVALMTIEGDMTLRLALQGDE